MFVTVELANEQRTRYMLSMALLPLSSRARIRDQVTAIDLGSHTLKAVHLQHKGGRFTLNHFAIQDLPVHEGALPPEKLAEALSKVHQSLGVRGKQVVMALGSGDAILRLAELPLATAADMRTMLRYNARTYLQQELSDHVFDCHVLPLRSTSNTETIKLGTKCRVVVGGARAGLVDELQAAARTAGLVPDAIVPGLIGPANAFESAQPARFGQDAVALVDIGFRHSSIAILLKGELALTRVVAIGGDRLTQGVAEALGTSYAEAEGIKVGLAHEVQSTITSLLSPLARELRASIDFFEHQQDTSVAEVFVSGGSACSPYILEIVQAELTVPCVAWNPAGSLTLNLTPENLEEIEQAAPRLATAIGSGLAAF
jgi:type IV pilus assembly protein PilM